MSNIRLFLIEDQPRILKTQIKLLENYHDIEIVDTAMTGEDALEILEGKAALPNVVLCDLGLPYMSGIEVTKSIKTRYPAIEVLMFTVFDEEEKVIGAIRAGASGYILKGTTAPKIVEAIREVHQGGTIIQPSLARRLLKHFKMPEQGKPTIIQTPNSGVNLTVRELECLQMIAKGLSNTEAGEVLGLSKATVRTHLEHVYNKLDVSNRVEAVTEGIRQGIVSI